MTEYINRADVAEVKDGEWLNVLFTQQYRWACGVQYMDAKLTEKIW